MEKITNKSAIFKDNQIWLFLISGLLLVGAFSYWWTNHQLNRPVMVNDLVFNQNSDDSDKNNRLTEFANLAKIDFIFTPIEGPAIVVKADPKEAGITPNLELMIQKINDKYKFSLQNIFSLSKNRNLDFLTTIDESKLMAFVTENFINQLPQLKNPTAIYNRGSNQFELLNGQSGYLIDLKESIDVDNFNLKKDNQIDIKNAKQEPPIKLATAQAVVEELNQLLGLRFNLKHKGNLLYFADPWDIADWVTIEEKEDKLEIDFSKNAIHEFLTNKVFPTIKRGAIARRVLVSKEGEFMQVLQYGRSGLGEANPDGVVAGIYNAIKNKQGLDQELDIQEVNLPDTQVVFSGGKWIDINLSTQRVVLYSEQEALQQFLVSTGLAPHYTPTGEFYVWHKNPKQRMIGGNKDKGTYYNLPNVTWNTYFTHSGVAFHTAYWHSNFGYPMSHGCINMREADAKAIYDFAPIGTRVIVHY